MINVDKIERSSLKKIIDISSFVINNLNESNAENLYELFIKFENDVKKIVRNEKKSPPQIWTQFSSMTEEEIRQEFNNIKKYPDIESIKAAIKGYVELRKLSKIKNRETIIDHIINTVRRGKFISDIGRQPIEH